MKYNFLILFFVLSLLGCKSGFEISQEKNDVDYQIINAFISLRKIKALKKETFEPKSRDSLLSKLMSSDGLNLFHYNLTENQENIDFEKIFSKDDFNFLREAFEQSEAIRIDKRKLLENIKVVSKLDNQLNARMIMLPVIVPNKNFAFIYSESSSDGDLFCMKNNNGKWLPFASFPIWTSD